MDNWTWRQLANAPPPWSRLEALSHHGSLKYAPLWLILVPGVVKVLKFLQERDLISRGTPLPIAMELLFASGVVALIAAGVFALRCPRLVKDYKSYPDFANLGKDANVLAQEFADDLRACTPPARWAAMNLKQIAADHGDAPFTEDEVSAMKEDLGVAVQNAHGLTIRPDQLNGAFWAMRNFVDDLRPASRYVYLILLLVALACAGWVLVRNIWIAAQFILSGA